MRSAVQVADLMQGGRTVATITPTDTGLRLVSHGLGEAALVQEAGVRRGRRFRDRGGRRSLSHSAGAAIRVEDDQLPLAQAVAALARDLVADAERMGIELRDPAI